MTGMATIQEATKGYTAFPNSVHWRRKKGGTHVSTWVSYIASHMPFAANAGGNPDDDADNFASKSSVAFKNPEPPHVEPTTPWT